MSSMSAHKNDSFPDAMQDLPGEDKDFLAVVERRPKVYSDREVASRKRCSR